MVVEGLLVLRNHFHMQCISFSDGAHIGWSMNHIRSPKLNSKVGVPYQLFTSPEEYGYINCATCLWLSELYHLIEQTDMERDPELITFDLEDNTVMSNGM